MVLQLRIVPVLLLAGWTTSLALAEQPLVQKSSAPEPLQTLTGHDGAVRSVAFSADGKTLASGSFDKTAKVWDVATGQKLATLRGHGDAHVGGANPMPGINSVTFAADGKILATGGLDGTVKLWDVAAKKELRTLTGHSNRVLSISMAPDGKTLASGSEDRSLRIWEIATGNLKSTLLGHVGAIEAVAFDADGTTLVSGATDGTIKLWDAAEGREITTLRMGNDVVSVALSRDRKSLAAGQGSGAVTLWYLGEKAERRVLGGHRAAVYSAAFSPDSKTLATASLDGTVRLWDVATSRRLASLDAHEKGAWTLAFSPDGKLLATGGEDRAVKLWDVAKVKEAATGAAAPAIVAEPPRAPQPQTGETEAIAEIKRLGGRFIGTGWRATFSPDGNRVAYGKIDAGSAQTFPALAVVDLKTGKTTELAKIGKDPAWSPRDGKHIAYTAGSDAAEEIWLIESSGAKPRQIAKGGFAAWSADGKTLFFHSHEKNKLMSTDPFSDDPAGQAKELMDVGSSYPAISGASKQIAYGVGGQLVVSSWEGGKATRTWPLQQVGSLVPGWSSDGKQLGVTGSDLRNMPTFWILDFESGSRLRVAAAPVGIPAWSPDGSKLAFDLRINFPSIVEVWMIETKVLEGLRPEELPEKLLGPPYRPLGKLSVIDLQPKGNHKLAAGEPDNPGNHLKELRQGEQTLAGVRFTIGESLVQLGSRRVSNFPEKVEGITVDKAAAKVYVLHATQCGGASFGAPDGTRIGEYAVHFDDGSQESIPIVCGEDLRDWWNNDGGQPVKRGRVAWIGKNEAAGASNETLRLYISAWQNPHPDRKIASIDFISAGTDAAPFCVAMTVEEPASAEAPPPPSSPTPKR